MSDFERWEPAPPAGQIPFRLLPCGHLEYVDSSSRRAAPGESCPVCGESVPRAGELAAARDYVPTPAFGWTGVALTDSRRLKFNQIVLVRML